MKVKALSSSRKNVWHAPIVSVIQTRRGCCAHRIQRVQRKTEFGMLGFERVGGMCHHVPELVQDINLSSRHFVAQRIRDAEDPVAV